MQNTIFCIRLYPAFEETRCVIWDVSVVITAHRRGRGGPNYFLAGGPEI